MLLLLLLLLYRWSFSTRNKLVRLCHVFHIVSLKSCFYLDFFLNTLPRTVSFKHTMNFLVELNATIDVETNSYTFEFYVDVRPSYRVYANGRTNYWSD